MTKWAFHPRFLCGCCKAGAFAGIVTVLVVGLANINRDHHNTWRKLCQGRARFTWVCRVGVDSLVRHVEGKPKECTEQGSSVLTSAVIHTQVETHELTRCTWGSDIRAEEQSLGPLGGTDSHLHRWHHEDTLIHPHWGGWSQFPRRHSVKLSLWCHISLYC